jgi:RNA polymerase sigma-70 factor (ECF subfamily)
VESEARFEELYRAYADRVHAYARRRSSPAMADEVVADVFLVVWRRLDRVPEQPLPWLLAVARKTLANRRRAEGRAAALRDRLVDLHRPVEPESETVDGRLFTALASLGDRDRELLLLIAWEGLEQAEVAAALGVRRTTVAMRLHRARRRLADALAAHDDDVLTPAEVRR